jgi:ABC-type uncharacterized transport system auxiliary subunit
VIRKIVSLVFALAYAALLLGCATEQDAATTSCHSGARPPLNQYMKMNEDEEFAETGGRM